MATRSVRISFQISNVDRRETLDFTEPLPASLCTSPDQARNLQNYEHDFTNVMRHICAKHMAACLKVNTANCRQCQAPPTRMTQSPMSYLHRPEPLVVVMTAPICDRRECELGMEKEMNTMLRETTGVDGPGYVDERFGEPQRDAQDDADWTECGFCRRLRETKRCGRCKRAAYCSRECQKNDWKMHKVMCKIVPAGV